MIVRLDHVIIIYLFFPVIIISPNNENNSERENLIISTIELVRKFPKKDENSSTN